jgi:pyruvate/2-oxoglutarate dehydrogenase complex dihydrolipoamide acyltransferase (E2) component
MPKLGLEMVEGTVLDWKLDEGDSIDADDVLLEIESEKTVADVDVREDGVLRCRYVEEGETVEVGTPLGIVAPVDVDVTDLVEEAEQEFEEASQVPTDGESTPVTTGDDSERTAPRDTDSVKATPRAASRAEELGVELDAVDGTGYEGAVEAADVESYANGADNADESDAGGTNESSDSAATTDDGPKVTPRAKPLVEEHDVDPRAIEGSGYDGAVTADDVEAAVEAATGGPPDVTTGDASVGDDGPPSLTVADVHELGSIRRTIARRLGESDREAVHVTIHRSADIETLERVVDDLDTSTDVDTSLVDLLIAALSDALEAHPAFNARFEDDVHRSYEEHNVALAVDADAGLVTPTLHDVRDLSIEGIATQRRRITERALDGEYTSDDLANGTFTVTNLGPMGVEWFDPVIDPPQVAILGVGAVTERPTTAEDGTLELRDELSLSLSFDHRLVDGADAARFLETIVELLENPNEIAGVGEGDGSPVDERTRNVRRAVARSGAGVSGGSSLGGPRYRSTSPSTWVGRELHRRRSRCWWPHCPRVCR